MSQKLGILLDLNDGLVLWFCIDCYELVLYCGQEATVRTETEWFPVGKRIKQGGILSPYLLNLYAEHI